MKASVSLILIMTGLLVLTNGMWAWAYLNARSIVGDLQHQRTLSVARENVLQRLILEAPRSGQIEDVIAHLREAFSNAVVKLGGDQTKHTVEVDAIAMEYDDGVLRAVRAW